MARIIHFELTADDPERAVQFYQNVFGWQIHKWEGPEDYWLATTGAKGTPGIDGAIMRRDTTAQGTINTIDVASVDEAVAKITANGGSVVAPKMYIPNIGHFAYCQDTEGNTFGVMESDRPAT